MPQITPIVENTPIILNDAGDAGYYLSCLHQADAPCVICQTSYEFGAEPINMPIAMIDEFTIITADHFIEKDREFPWNWVFVEYSANAIRAKK